jgi:hypothetical protein
MINEKKSQPKAILLGNFLKGNEFGNPQSQKINLAIQKFCDKMSTFKFTHNIDEKSPRIEQPDKIIISLKEHQKALIHRARQLENMIPLTIEENKQIIAKFGVICDHVGAGKSYEVLGTIANSPVLNNQSNFITLNDVFHGVKSSSFKFYSSSKKINTNIIAVPHGVFKQWEDYIKKFTKLSCYSINTFQTLRNAILDYKLDEMLVSDEEIHDNVIDGLLEDLRSHKFKPKHSNELFLHKQKQPRDTKYYRYLEPYLNKNPETVEIVKAYGSLDFNRLNNTIEDKINKDSLSKNNHIKYIHDIDIKINNQSKEEMDRLKDLFSPVVFNFTFSVICSSDENMKDAGYRELDKINRGQNYR